MEEFYAPTEYVEGEMAKSELEKCANVCMKNAECSLVMMPNEGGKNDECVYYGAETEAMDEVKKTLNQLNESTDTMKATHYAVIHK
jgi:hypothetical protein